MRHRFLPPGRRLVLLAWLASAGAAAGAPPGDDLVKPLWELGGGVASARLPQYRGSDEYSVYTLPFPFFIYRGEWLKATRDGVRTVFLRAPRAETDLSFFGNPPVGSGNRARAGMPDLDPVLEAGPGAKWFLTPRDARRVVYLRPAARAVAAVGWDGGPETSYQGLHAEAGVVYRDRALGGKACWKGGGMAGVEFTDPRYNRYFYDVPEAYATAERPAYRSRGGYAGFKLAANLVREFPAHVYAGVYAAWANQDGAACADSPLVRARNNVTVGFVIGWNFARSGRTMRVDTSED